MIRIIILAVVFGGLIFGVAKVEGGTVYVAANGNDSWSGFLAEPNAGRTDGPVATLKTACRIARGQTAADGRKVVVQAGRYFFNEPLRLSATDSGLTIEAVPGSDVSFHGGKTIANWKRDGEKFYSVALPGVKEGKWDFRTLFVNGRYCGRARLPEKGYFRHLSKFKVPWMSTTGGGWKRKPTEKELTTLKYRPEDLGPRLDVNNAEITVYHMWDESLVGLAGIDTESHTLSFSSPSSHPPGAFGVDRYVVWNVREGMTQPGQFYLDRTTGTLVYWPLPGEDMTKAEVFAPTIESIIRIAGTKKNPAKDIMIRGLKLSVTTTPLMAGGFGAGKFDGAVSVTNAENCRLIELEISNVGGQGIKAFGNGLRVEKCQVHHTGACGVRCRGTGCVVADNHNHMAKNNTIRGNVFICDSDTRITFPKSSGYIFENNVVHAQGKITFENPDAIMAFHNNVLFGAKGKVRLKKLRNYSATDVTVFGSDGKNILADPFVTEYDKGVVRFAAESPVHKLGIEPIDVSGAGVRK
jgi:hypothetical protein